jgi:hypothetical protein
MRFGASPKTIKPIVAIAFDSVPAVDALFHFTLDAPNPVCAFRKTLFARAAFCPLFSTQIKTQAVKLFSFSSSCYQLLNLKVYF